MDQATPRTALPATTLSPPSPVAASAHPHRAVPGAAGQAGAVGRPRHRRHRAACGRPAVPQLLARGRVPHPHRAVPGAAGQAGAVGRPRHRRSPSWCGPRARAAPRPWPRPTPAPCRRRRRWPGGCRRATTPPTSPQLVWPVRARSSSPVAASHTRTVLSPAPLARRVPSGDHATDATALVWPGRARSSSPVAASHTRTVSS